VDGARLGAYALVHATGAEIGARPTPPHAPVGFNPRTSAGRLRAMSAGAAHSGRPAT
jgi:hypothetical protein